MAATSRSVQFGFSPLKFVMAAGLDVLSKFDRASEIPKIPLREFLVLKRGPERWEYLRRAYSAKGPMLQISIMPGWLKAALVKIGPTSNLRAHFTAYPERLILVGDAGWLADLVRQSDGLERVYESLKFQMTVGADSIFIVNDEKDWRATHDLLIPYFTREKSARLYTQMIRSEAAVVAEKFVDEDQQVSLRKLADLTSAAVIHRLLFGSSIDATDFLNLSRLAEDVWIGEPANGGERTAYRYEFEKIVEKVRVRMPPSCLMAILERQAHTRPHSHAHGHANAEQWLMNQLITLFFAGQETTRVLLAFAIYELASRAKYQSLFRHPSEANEILRSSFLREVLRRNPPVAWIPRRALRDLKVGPYIVPAGSSIQIDMKAIHGLPSNWVERPDDFYPERFLERENSLRFCPFGFGKRVCIGQHLAFLEADIVLQEWLHRYELEVFDVNPPQSDFSRSGVPSMRDDYCLVFRPRDVARLHQEPNPAVPSSRSEEIRIATENPGPA